MCTYPFPHITELPSLIAIPLPQSLSFSLFNLKFLHFLSSFTWKTYTKEDRCEECGGKISGTAFTCTLCNVWKHISCADKLNSDLPHEIVHPLHLQHRLQLIWRYEEDFICDKCLYVSTAGYRYICSSCDFNLDLTCASSASAQLPKDQEPLRFKDGKRKTISHYSHFHEMSFFKYRKVNDEDYDCFWCEKHLLPSEGYFGCRICKFYLHQVCSDKIPRRLFHSFHPKHPLRLTYTHDSVFYSLLFPLDDVKSKCNACLKESRGDSPSYVCEMCSFYLDFHCAKLSPSLKLDCHHHLLTFFKYFIKKGDRWDSYCKAYCKACGKDCGGASVYRCVPCDFSLHLKCVVSSSAKHKYHRHPLMMELLKEDDSEEYYCDVYENKRNPKDPVCTFISHIQCVLDQDKVSLVKVPSSSPPPMEIKALFVDEMKQNEGIDVIRTLIRPIIHRHQMYEVTEELKRKTYCYGCRLLLDGPTYFCEACPEVYLHEKCAKLSYEIRHPFHSSHPLNLYTLTDHSIVWRVYFIACDECRDICHGFIYCCEQCNFKLDVKCATLATHKVGGLEEKEMGRVTELRHFTHHHKLVLGNYNDPEHKTTCIICELQILGPSYFCPQKMCYYISHESCLRLPQKIQVPFHLNHMLVGRQVPYINSSLKCYACTLYLGSGKFAYSCEHCNFDLHTICANSLRRPLKCEFLQDDLYYFGRNHESFRSPCLSIKFDCYECDGRCNGEPFYRCLKGKINFHLKCVPIPVKSKYHIHPLILKDSFIEDDSGKYYCDFCEEERNPNDDIYYCQECNGQITTHIECVLPEVEDDYIEIRKNNHEERLRKKAPIEEVIQAGVVPRFVELLGSPNDDVRKRVAWALGKIASNSLRCRDQVLGHGALLPFLALLNEHAEFPMLRIATQSLSMFCKPPFDQVKLVLPTLARIIHSNDDELVLDHVCWALAYLSDATNDKIQAVIKADVCGRLVELLMHPSPSVIAPALYTIGRIVTDVQVQLLNMIFFFSYSWTNLVATQSVISRQALPCLLNLLTNNYEKSIKEFACSIISNIMVGNDEHIQAVIEANIIAPLVHLLQNAEFDIKKQAAWAILIATYGTHDQIRFLVSQDCIKPMCDFLNCPDQEVVTICLQGLENILKVGEAEKNMGTTGKVNLYAQMIDAAKGREKIEYLRFHDNTEIYEMAVEVLETYW
ncbi:hypothetical protein CXB51_029086 [Gossypium anomalum]|uniref:Phorbol-ester/DAG-type domain-containing protein n=1 Tax=Gossypium anomalum TaxID=47600 RepID=A0A8J6CQZ3_9ROSI|nr:hypothetical protein CXB51_029086 [Gossypium anomalum]